MPVTRCPKCGKVISTRFTVHDCKPLTSGPMLDLALSYP